MVFFIWRGFGILVPIITLALLSAMEVIVDAFGGPNAYAQGTRVWTTLALVLAATAVWFLGRYLNTRPRPILINQATGAEVRQGVRHSIFFIPMEYWAGLLVIAAVISLMIG